MQYFNPQGPRGPRPGHYGPHDRDGRFQSTRPSRASTKYCPYAFTSFKISIHKALAGLDLIILGGRRGIGHFNPQGPRGPRLSQTMVVCIRHLFQSTRPSRASTQQRNCLTSLFFDFNPQGPRGPRLSNKDLLSVSVNFNPQGPRGPRRKITFFNFVGNRFQSTRPSRASTINNHLIAITIPISIHKALAGLDFITELRGRGYVDFNPQGPRGPRRTGYTACCTGARFQSTRPSRASTQRLHRLLSWDMISIHKALAGLDVAWPPPAQRPGHFNPQGPRGPRPDLFHGFTPFLYFNPQGPRGPRPVSGRD